MADVKDGGVDRASPEGSPGSQAFPDPRHSRSCVNCYQRKVRCDRKSPCNHCARGGLRCIYPGAERGLPKKATSLHDVSGRLERLERLLVEALGGDTIRAGSGKDSQRPSSRNETLVVPEVSIKSARSCSSRCRPWEALLQAGNRAHYVDNTNLLDLFQDVCHQN